MSNPQMREIIDRNPELGHVLNEPSTLRQTPEATRNPETMKEMMRNTDRTMNNIESSSKRLNMLRRMYETIQEPFLNATTTTGESGDAGSNPSAALLGNPGAALTTDHSTTTASETTNDFPILNVDPLPNPWGNAAMGKPTSNTQSTATNSETVAPGIVGLGVLGIPTLGSMAGGISDPSMLNQVLQNLTMSKMMRSLLSNPQYMNKFEPHDASCYGCEPLIERDDVES